MKTVVITGASRGIGLATAKKFLAEGWKVIGTYNNTPISIADKNFTAIKYDQGNSESIKEAASRISQAIAKLDALINNAGTLLDADEVVANPEKVRKTFEVNVVGVIDLTERLLSILDKGSHVVNINSGYGSISAPILDDASVAGYRISKAGLNMYTRHLAFRLKPRGIKVSSLAPGWVKTDMGYAVATESEGPDRTPEQAADDIYALVTRVKESGQFWRKGKTTEW